MEIILKLDGRKGGTFLEYLHAAYRSRGGLFFGPQGSARYMADGSYETLLAFPLSVAEVSVPLTWRIVIKTDGSIEKFEIFSDEVPEERWATEVSKFVTEILASAFSETKSKYVYRDCFCYVGPDLHGEYWLPGFRFAPATSEDERSYWRDAERYFFIDQEIEAIDQVHGGDLAAERAMRYAARLSLILNAPLYRPARGKCWIMEEDASGNLTSKLVQRGFVMPPFPSQMPRKGEVHRLGEYSGSVLGDQDSLSLLKCPVEIRRILRGLATREPVLQDAFDSCARLYQTSLVAGQGFPTIRLAYQVGAVEAIVKKGGGYSGFSDFVRKESLNGDSGHDDFLDYLYGRVRSGHFHVGEFPLGDYRPSKMSLGVADSSVLDLFNVNEKASHLLRRSIMAWVMREIAEPE